MDVDVNPRSMIERLYYFIFFLSIYCSYIQRRHLRSLHPTLAFTSNMLLLTVTIGHDCSNSFPAQIRNLVIQKKNIASLLLLFISKFRLGSCLFQRFYQVLWTYSLFTEMLTKSSTWMNWQRLFQQVWLQLQQLQKFCAEGALYMNWEDDFLSLYIAPCLT